MMSSVLLLVSPMTSVFTPGIWAYGSRGERGVAPRLLQLNLEHKSVKRGGS